MPVVLVVAPPPVDGTEAEALAAVNAAIADGLDLEPGDVYSTFVPAGTSLLGATPVTAWPVVLVHGSPRAADRTARALDNARAAVRTIWQCAPQELWVQWL